MQIVQRYSSPYAPVLVGDDHRSPILPRAQQKSQPELAAWAPETADVAMAEPAPRRAAKRLTTLRDPAEAARDSLSGNREGWWTRALTRYLALYSAFRGFGGYGGDNDDGRRRLLLATPTPTWPALNLGQGIDRHIADSQFALAAQNLSAAQPQYLASNTLDIASAMATILAQDPFDSQAPKNNQIYVQGSALMRNGSPLRLHGVNIYDSRMNRIACAPASEWDGRQTLATTESLRFTELKRRIDLARASGANFFRILCDLEPLNFPTTSVNASASRLLTDGAYATGLASLVAYITADNDSVADLTFFTDPGGDLSQPDSSGRYAAAARLPNPRSLSSWRKVIGLLGQNPSVIYSLANEPRNSQLAADYPSALTTARSNIEAVVLGIRQVERELQTPAHLVKVPGLQTTGKLCCSRDLTLWQSRPLADPQVIYSAHWYEPYDTVINNEYLPFAGLPIMVDEIAPGMQGMSQLDMYRLLGTFEQRQPPLSYAAWALTANQGGLTAAAAATSDPNVGSMLTYQDLAPAAGAPENNACGISMPLTLTPKWGAPYFAWMKGVDQAWKRAHH